MNLQDEIVDQMGKEIAKEIDFEIMSDMMVTLGWHKVRLKRFWNNNHAINVLNWCEENVKGNYKNLGATFVFEKQGDAVNFTLKWV